MTPEEFAKAAGLEEPENTVCGVNQSVAFRALAATVSFCAGTSGEDGSFIAGAVCGTVSLIASTAIKSQGYEPSMQLAGGLVAGLMTCKVVK